MSIFSHYSVREVSNETRHGAYAVEHPESHLIVSNQSFDDGYLVRPLTYPLNEAIACAEYLTSTTQSPWEIVGAPNPCSNCGRVIWTDDMDFCYPQNRERNLWIAGCMEHNGGCGHDVVGKTYHQTMSRWNHIKKVDAL